jgi:hypothetical protein
MYRRLAELSEDDHPASGFLAKAAHEFTMMLTELDQRAETIGAQAAEFAARREELEVRVAELEQALAHIAEAGGAQIAWEVLDG